MLFLVIGIKNLAVAVSLPTPKHTHTSFCQFLSLQLKT